MKNYKIKIQNETQFNEVIELAKKIGYKKPDFIIYEIINDYLFLKHNGMLHTGTFEPETYKEITIEQLRILADPESLIGRKVKGFWFNTNKFPKITYTILMDRFIDKVGVITSITSESCKVQFLNYYWRYPKELIHEHLIEEPQTKEELKKVWAWDDDLNEAFETYLIKEFEGFEQNYLCICKHELKAFENKEYFFTLPYKNISETDPRTPNDVLKIVEKYGKDKLITIIEKID